jgi:hypothetical protein
VDADQGETSPTVALRDGSLQTDLCLPLSEEWQAGVTLSAWKHTGWLTGLTADAPFVEWQSDALSVRLGGVPVPFGDEFDPEGQTETLDVGVPQPLQGLLPESATGVLFQARPDERDAPWGTLGVFDPHPFGSTFPVEPHLVGTLNLPFGRHGGVRLSGYAAVDGEHLRASSHRRGGGIEHQYRHRKLLTRLGVLAAESASGKGWDAYLAAQYRWGRLGDAFARCDVAASPAGQSGARFGGLTVGWTRAITKQLSLGLEWTMGGEAPDGAEGGATGGLRFRGSF